MATTEQERYILHLNHALAMENALVDHLEKRAQDIGSARIKLRVQQHRDETIDHRETLRSMIQSLNAQPTNGKATVQSPVGSGLIGSVKAALEGEKADHALNEALADYAVEHFESGVYMALAQMARNLGYPEHVPDFDRIQRQEQAMAEFIAHAGPEIVDQAFPPVSGQRAA